MAGPRPPFHAERYELGGSGSTGLTPLGPGEADVLGPALAMIDPWRRLGFQPGWLGPFLKAEGDGAVRFGIRQNGSLAGVVVVRPQWLAGPYLATIAVLPPFQHLGIGRAVMAWLEDEGGLARARNLWLCVSAFNDRGITFYEACGFAHVGRLDDLIKDGEDELLMRKRLTA